MSLVLIKSSVLTVYLGFGERLSKFPRILVVLNRLDYLHMYGLGGRLDGTRTACSYLIGHGSKRLVIQLLLMV
jgi:hypothetical protein